MLFNNCFFSKGAGAKESLIDIAHKFVESVAMPEGFCYDGEVLSPALQQFYSVLQSIALTEEKPEWDPERDDNMKMSEEIVAQYEEAVFLKFKLLAGLDDDNLPAPKVCVLVNVGLAYLCLNHWEKEL